MAARRVKEAVRHQEQSHPDEQDKQQDKQYSKEAAHSYLGERVMRGMSISSIDMPPCWKVLR